ncbi:MAG: hypothetical protein ACO1TE_20175 [Prosthecobacter sp.]
MNRLLLLGLSCLLLCQCKSVTLTGSAPNPPVKHLVIMDNDDVHMDDFQSELVNQIHEMGISTTVMKTIPENTDYLTYSANWYWDLGMYLRYFKATLHRQRTPLRSVVYENGGLDFSKYGEAPDKIRSPMRELLLGRP